MRGEAELRTRPGLLRRLEGLKRAYRAAYAELHRAAVLGPGERDRKDRLAGDARLRAVRALAGVNLLRENEPALNAWETRLNGLRVCADFHDGLLESSPLCSSAPAQPPDRTPVSPVAALDDLDGRLDALLAGWREALRAALAGDSVRHSLSGMTAAERRPIDAFLSAAADDTTLPAGFVESVNRALRGIDVLALSPAALLAALSAGGLPSAFDDMTQHSAPSWARPCAATTRTPRG